MSYLRTASTRRLMSIIAGVLIVVGGGTAIAVAAAGSGPVPRPKPLPQAIRAALSARPVAGITARVTFTNHLISGADMQGTDPLLTGASGRLWLGAGHRLRLELQGDNSDAQVVVNGRSAFISDPGMHTAYRFTLPAGTAKGMTGAGAGKAGADKIPTLSEIQSELTKLAQHLNISGAKPTDVGGQPSYSVSVAPRHDGGLLGSVELAWDAVHGVPLHFAVYAHGDSQPVLELTVDKISYRSVPASVFNVPVPSGEKVVTVRAPAAPAKPAHGVRERHHAAVNGAAAVARRLPFALVAPAQLVGLPRHTVTLLDWGGHPAALVTYGQNLGGVAVIEQRADAAPAKPAPSSGHGDRQGLSLPTVSINGATGQELDTALGTVVRFTRAGVSYTVIGSIQATAADAAARAL
jgi:hypothetical protein